MSINIGNSEVINIYIGDSAATAVYIGDTQIWGVGGKDYSKEYFTIEMLSAGTITWNPTAGYVPSGSISFSVDDGSTWNTWDDANGYSANQGDKILFKSNRMDFGGHYSSAAYLKSSGEFIVYGNIMSLGYGDNFYGQTTLTANRAYKNLLRGNQDKLLSVENLILPATTMRNSCYQGMFENCTAITKAPILPATSLLDYCYSEMFYGCTNLNYVKCLATSLTGYSPTGVWLNGVSATGTFVKAAGMNDWGTGTSGIPDNWTVIDA